MSEEPHIPEEWSDAERWAWEEIQAGRIVDFHERYARKLDPEKSDGWDNKRQDHRLSQAFLVAILTDERYRNITLFSGVRINGAYFEEAIDLQHVRLEQQLWLEYCRFHRTLSMKDLRVNGWFSLEGSWFSEAVDLTFAKIGGQLNMRGSTFNDMLNMSESEVGQNLLMHDGANFQDVDLKHAKIGGQISMDDSTFDGTPWGRTSHSQVFSYIKQKTALPKRKGSVIVPLDDFPKMNGPRPSRSEVVNILA